MQKLIVLPTQQTVDLLRNVFSGVNIDIDFYALGVEVGSSMQVPITVNDEATYRALPGSMGAWYETASARSYWLLPLIPSPELVKRHNEVGDAWGRSFLPFLKIAEVHTNHRNHKTRMNSVATGLIDMQPILTFHAELVMEDNALVPSQADYHNDYEARGNVSNQIFVELEDGTE